MVDSKVKADLQMDNTAKIFEQISKHPNLPQSMLFYGSSPAAIEQFADKLVMSLRCTEESACGSCQECLSFLSGEHPEVFTCGEATASSGAIKIEQIRDAIEHLSWYSATRGDGRRSWRIVLIRGAANMTEQAANAFLKTLEEPPDGALILMTARHPRTLLDTLRSRLVAIRIPGSESLPELSLDVVKAVRETLFADSLGSALRASEVTSRQMRLKPAEFAVAAEMVMNDEYRKILRSGRPISSGLSVGFSARCRARRHVLGQLHQMAGQRRIALNTQLAAEMSGPVAEVFAEYRNDQTD